MIDEPITHCIACGHELIPEQVTRGCPECGATPDRWGRRRRRLERADTALAIGTLGHVVFLLLIGLVLLSLLLGAIVDSNLVGVAVFLLPWAAAVYAIGAVSTLVGGACLIGCRFTVWPIARVRRAVILLGVTTIPFVAAFWWIGSIV